MPGDEGYDQELEKQTQPEKFNINEFLDAAEENDFDALADMPETSFQSLTKGKYKWSDGTYHSNPESSADAGAAGTYGDLESKPMDLPKKEDKEKNNNTVISHFKDNPIGGLLDPNKTMLNVSQPLSGIKGSNYYHLSFPGLNTTNSKVSDNFWNPQSINYLHSQYGAFQAPGQTQGWNNYLLEQEAYEWRLNNPNVTVNQKYVSGEYPSQFRTPEGEPMTDATYMTSMEGMVFNWFNNDPTGQLYYQQYMQTAADVLQDDYQNTVYNDYLNGITNDAYSKMAVETGEIDPLTKIPYKQFQFASDDPILAQVATKRFITNKTWNNVTNQINAGGRFTKSDAENALVLQQEGWALKTEYTNFIDKTTEDLYKNAGIYTEAGLKAAMLEAKRLNPIDTWNDGALIKQNEKYVKFLSKEGFQGTPVMIWGFDQETGKQKLISSESENLTDAQLEEISKIEKLYNSVTDGMFTNDHIEQTLGNLEYELIYSLGVLATQGSETYNTYESGEVTNQLYGGAALYQRGYLAGNIEDQGVLSYFVKEMADSDDIADFIAKASGSKVLGELELLDNPLDNPLINFYNSKLNTYRALGEAYVMNYNPIESLYDPQGEYVDPLESPFKWYVETTKSLLHGISTSKEGLFNIDEYTTDDFQTEFVMSLQSDPELTPYDESQISKNEMRYKEKVTDVDMAVRIGRTLPTFAGMALEIAAIELATGGMGSGAVAAKSPLYLRRLYQAWGAGRKTAKVMAGVSKAFVKESINLHGANYLGKSLYGREEMPVYTFAAGSTFAHFGMGAMGRAWKLFGRNMKNAGRAGSPAGKMWNTATSIIDKSPTTLINLATYAPKKFTQAGMGVGAIKAGEFTSGLWDVAMGETTYDEFWKHVTDTDSIIELFGTMLAMGAKSGLRDTSNAVRDVFGDFAKLSGPASTRNFNRIATNKNWGTGEGALGKKRKFNKKSLIKNWSEGEFGGESYWGKLEIEGKRKILLTELKDLSSKEIKEKYGVETLKEAESIINKQAKVLSSKGQIDFYTANQTRIEKAVFGRNSFFGKFNNVMSRYRKNNGALRLEDRLELGEIASFSDYNKIVHEVMAKTGATESQAQGLIKGAQSLAESIGQLGFKRGSKLEKRFLDVEQKLFDVSSQKKTLKLALERSEINEGTYKLRLEELNILEKEYVENSKKIISENEKSIVEEIKQQEKRITGNKVFVAKEGKTVAETAKELGFEDYKASEHEYGLQTSKINPKTGKAESIIIIDPVKASKAQTRFFEATAVKKHRSKILKLKEDYDAGKISKKVFEKRFNKAEKELSKAETKQTKSLLESVTKGEARIDRAANREVLFHEEVHPIVEKYVNGPNGKKLVNEFIDALKESGAYDAVWNKLQRHTDVAGNKNYRGSEWFTIFGELAKSGKLNELFKAQKNTRIWDNFASLITKGVREHTPLKDYKISDGLSAIEFIKNFAEGDVKATETALKATEEYKEWIANPENKRAVNKAAENVKDVEGDMIDLYEEYKDTWIEGGSMEALKEMAKGGLLTRLIGAQIPYPKPKGWTPKVNDAFIRDVYGEMTQLISGFKESKQTTSGSKGFFAYVNSFLRFKALNVLKEIGVFDKTKSLDEMKEDKGFDIKDSGELSSEIYTPKTSKEVSSELKLSDATVKKLDIDLSNLKSKELVEAYDTPTGRNQTISPFIREFKKQFGSLGEKVIAKNMGKNKAEYKKYLEDNFLGIVNNLPVGYMSRNFPYLVEKGTHAGSTGRDTRWTSGPSAIKLKENFSEGGCK